MTDINRPNRLTTGSDVASIRNMTPAEEKAALINRFENEVLGPQEKRTDLSDKDREYLAAQKENLADLRRRTI